MKKFKFYLFAMLAALVGVVSSCSVSSDEVEQSPFNECSALKFKQRIDTCKARGYNYAIVDYRSQAKYAEGHIPGAIWIMEGNTTNMDNGSLAKQILAQVGNNTKAYIFLVGENNYTLITTMAGSVSSAGFGQSHTYTLLGGYDAWVEAGYEVEK